MPPLNEQTCARVCVPLRWNQSLARVPEQYIETENRRAKDAAISVAFVHTSVRTFGVSADTRY